MKKVSPDWLNQTKTPDQSQVFNYQDNEWTKLSASYRRENPLCAYCKIEGKIRVGVVCDHVISMKQGGHPTDRRNLQHLCRTHDNKKRYDESQGIVLPHEGDYGQYLPI